MAITKSKTRELPKAVKQSAAEASPEMVAAANSILNGDLLDASGDTTLKDPTERKASAQKEASELKKLVDKMGESRGLKASAIWVPSEQVFVVGLKTSKTTTTTTTSKVKAA